MPRIPRLAVLLVLGFTACLGAPDIPARDPSRAAGDDASVGDGSTAGLALSVEGEDGLAHIASAAPRRPVLVARGAGALEGAPEPVLLFEGAPDAALLDDLERPPLRIDHAARRVPLEVARDASGIRARAAAPLAPGRTYTFAVAAWATRTDGAVPGVVAFPFTVAGTEAGAVLSEIFPPEGSAGVDPGLPFVVVRFDDDVTGLEGLSLLEVGGSVVPAALAATPCETLGFAPGVCVTLAPLDPLRPSTEHRVYVPSSVRDRTSASVGPVEARFTTGGGAPPATVLVAPPCAIDERLLGPLCVLEQDTTVRVAGRASAPVRAFLSLGAQRVGTVASRGDIALVLASLPASTTFAARLEAVDASGRVLAIELELRTTPPLPTIDIAEIRADANGPEPAQEYVELWNRSDVAVDLSGFRLADRPDSAGDALPTPSFLPARARALVVADAFDPTDPADPVVPPGAPLFRIGASIATSGLANAGEPLFLRDANGHRIAEAPALAAPGPGRCIARLGGASRVPGPDDYGPTADGGCSPGIP